MKEIHQTDQYDDTAQALFERNMLEQEMGERSSGPKADLSPQRLYQLACGLLGSTERAPVYQLLAEAPAARKSYRTLIDQMSLVRLPQSMAAASDGLPVRNSEGCRIRLQESKAEPEQLYLIIELSGILKSDPERLTVFDATDNSYSLDLAAPRNGVIQMIVERSEKIATLLSDPKSEAFLS